jgi:hypothetical protein
MKLFKLTRFRSGECESPLYVFAESESDLVEISGTATELTPTETRSFCAARLGETTSPAKARASRLNGLKGGKRK